MRLRAAPPAAGGRADEGTGEHNVIWRLARMHTHLQECIGNPYRYLRNLGPELLLVHVLYRVLLGPRGVRFTGGCSELLAGAHTDTRTHLLTV
eukprot:COSAG02_NODE_2600_length_8448_cov_43.599473_6_plen_93_part_00